MKNLELTQMENLSGGKFWGWTDFKPNGPCHNGFQSYHREYHIFGLAVSHDYDLRPC